MKHFLIIFVLLPFTSCKQFENINTDNENNTLNLPNVIFSANSKNIQSRLPMGKD